MRRHRGRTNFQYLERTNNYHLCIFGTDVRRLVQTKQKLIRDDFPADKSSKAPEDGDSKDETSGSNEDDDQTGESGQGNNQQASPDAEEQHTSKQSS